MEQKKVCLLDTVVNDFGEDANPAKRLLLKCDECAVTRTSRNPRKYIECPKNNKVLVLSSDPAKVWVKPVGKGAGTYLRAITKRILRYMKYDRDIACSCNAKAKIMNKMGNVWCRQNQEEILGWIKENAHTLGIPWNAKNRYGAKFSLLLAIRKSEKSGWVRPLDDALSGNGGKPKV